MGLTYSRDGMARPLQILNDMLQEIRNSVFHPDCTRSGRLVRSNIQSEGSLGNQKAQETAVKVEDSDEDDELNAWDLIPSSEPQNLPSAIPDESEHEINDACTETSSSECSDGSSAESPFEHTGTRMFEPPRAPEGFTLWQHSKSKILHLVDHRFPNVFACGRRPGAFHTSQGLNPRWDTGICWKCFKNK